VLVLHNVDVVCEHCYISRMPTILELLLHLTPKSWLTS
jgi:hypothetical protein